MDGKSDVNVKSCSCKACLKLYPNFPWVTDCKIRASFCQLRASDYFPRASYLRFQSSRPQSEGIRRHRGPRRTGRLRRCRTGRMQCYFQSLLSRCGARSSPGWTGRGSASALQQEANSGSASARLVATHRGKLDF